jgi:hypothetical protein
MFLLLAVAAVMVAAMIGSAGPVFGEGGCGGVNNAKAKGAVLPGNIKWSNIELCAADILPPGQENPPTP